MNNSDGERKALAQAKRQVACQIVDLILQTEARHEIVDPLLHVPGLQMEQAGVQTQVLGNGQFAIERKRLRHVADPLASLDVVGLGGASQDPGLAIGGRQ